MKKNEGLSSKLDFVIKENEFLKNKIASISKDLDLISKENISLKNDLDTHVCHASVASPSSVTIACSTSSSNIENDINILKKNVDCLGTFGMVLWYPKTGQFHMTSYSYIDYAGYRVDRKSTSETYQFLENCLIS